VRLVAEESSDEAPAFAEPLDPAPEVEVFWLPTVDTFVLAPESSRHARIPPRESMAATLTAVTMTRARTARGDLPRRKRSGSAMGETVRIASESTVRDVEEPGSRSPEWVFPAPG
jgi:hypothetical protein